ncbi:EAL domain-containing protein [Anaerocolumna sp. AGMB13025]|uniref:putative bifunctional diguanylate cyclase/phosphodiesterase n=1 Tax=Anaerocolumna sp. AGMB13025 TaxID=3039116 RepID=UPI00241F1E3F|nr:EAL domain-containing protein [Anaerocolumna sp. AGMB13025]WFR55060.1 EAL domain-containing protein [Anaerocolumna sp. AGMB13025]
MQNNKIELETLADGGKAYIVNWIIGDLIIIAALVLVILLVILLINVKRKTKGERAALLEKQKWNENYNELQTAYEEISTSKNELSVKYEELKRTKDKLSKLAYSDYLTELPNRLSFTEMLDSVMLTLRNEEVIALMNIDIDNFKIINDTLGHSYGDELLIDVTHRLKQAMDDNDYLARSGGDEYIVLSQNLTDIGEYEAKIKKIQKIFDYPFVLSMKEYFITVSIGIAMAPKDGKTTQVLIKNADSAMYAAKANGKNTFVYFDASINEKLMDKIQSQSELRKAIENKEFMIYYQPQVDLNQDRIVGFEALIRWNHPEKGVLLPGDFIPLTEETGLIVPIGRWILKHACEQLKVWEEKGFKDLIMAVNISARQFKDQEFVNMVREIIHEVGINPNYLQLEITESIALQDIDYSIAVIQKLKELGVLFALDNFGTDYSSMNYLKRLPVNNLKIDKSFLRTVLDSQSNQNMVQTIISLAQNLNLNVIAEGVERNEQAEFLKRIKCNMAQGYFYSEPLPDSMAEQLLLKM